LQSALSLARQNNLGEVLKIFKKCLGQMLNAAATAGDKGCLDYLIQAGANVNFEEENYDGIPEVAFRNYVAGLYVLNHHPTIDPEEVLDHLSSHNDGCFKCVMYLLDQGYEDTIELVYRHSFRHCQTPLLTAIEHNKNDCVQSLLQAGSSMVTDCGAYTEHNHVTPVERAILLNNAEGLQLLIQSDLDVNASLDKSVVKKVHHQCLSLFQETNYTEGLELLKQCDFDVNASLDKAIVKEAQQECLSVLLKAGIHTKLLHESSDSILSIAAGSKGADVPHLHQEDQPYSLMYVCRTVIRRKLLQCNQVNLFKTATASHLALPQRLCEYLVCDQTLD
jgi:ankyrin repeat protein